VKRPVQFGKYYLLERVNVGGMAEVFKAKAYGVEGFERLVAVKRILPNIAEDEEFITMFIDEAKIAVQLTHANIAQVFDLGRVEDSYFIALEYVQGKDLRAIFDRCRQQGSDPMPIAQACFAVMKVCEGLDYAHNKRDPQGREMHLVHRDVSPQNVLVSYEGEVKLIDFGIAKAIGKASQTQAGILKGKFGYMSPEQVRGLPIDRRSDVFSVGIVLYEMLTGERLFVGESDFSTLEKVRNVEILPPTAYNRRIPEELERIVLKALAKDVEDRYQNAIDLHDELQAFVYTAGEFCSRKDLAAWMKKFFAQELAEENAKMDQYRDLPPPSADAEPDEPAPSMRGPKPSQRQPAVTSPQMPAAKMPGSKTRPPVGAPGRNGRPSGAQAAQSAQPAQAKGKGGGANLEWDDEELETHVYGDGDAPPLQDRSSIIVTDADLEPATPAPRKAPVSFDEIMSQTERTPLPVKPVAQSAKSMPIGAVAQPVPGFAAQAAQAAQAPQAPQNGPSPQAAWAGNGAARVSGGGSMPPGQMQAMGAAPQAYIPQMGPPNIQLPVPVQPPYHAQPGAPTVLDRPSPMALGEPSSVRAIASSPQMARPLFPVHPQARRSNKALIGVIAAACVIVSAGATVLYMRLHKPPLAQVYLSSNPAGAEVLVNNSPSARTPVTLTLAQGTYLLEIQSPGYKSWDQQVSVSAGQALTLPAVTLDLEQPLSLSISSDPPNAHVQVDGSDRGVTPVQVDGIAVGSHHVQISLDGYGDQTKDVDVEPGQPNAVSVKLVATGPVAHIVSTPPGAQAFLVHGGATDPVGTTPCDGPIDPTQKYQVKVTLDGFKDWMEPLATAGQTDVSVNAILTALPGGGQPVVAQQQAPPVPVVPPTPNPQAQQPDIDAPLPPPNPIPNPTPVPVPVQPTPPPVAATGTLKLSTTPASDVFVDDKEVGWTPTKTDIPAGPHMVTGVTNDGKHWGPFPVTVEAGQSVLFKKTDIE
jgi:serine/threonine protein kinase